MNWNELIGGFDNKIGPRSIKVKYIENYKDLLFVVLDNEQKFFTDGKNIYDVSEYDRYREIETIDGRLCAVLEKDYILHLVDLKTKEVLFFDKEAYAISKQDEKALHIIKRVGFSNTTIYSLENKKYLPVPDGYKFESSLNNGMYVFCEKDETYTKDFYDQNRCVININGEIILRDINGWIFLSDNNFIIIKENAIDIVELKSKDEYDIKTIEQNEKIIAKPQYYNGKIAIIEKGAIKIYNTNLEILKNIEIEGLNEVVDVELLNDIFKICVVHKVGERRVNKHIFVNLETCKYISHIRIEGYPYWDPKTFIGNDNIDEEFMRIGTSESLTEFSFYDSNFDLISKELGNQYEDIKDKDESLFVVKTKKDNKVKKVVVDTQNKITKEVEYDLISYHRSDTYGFGAGYSKDTIDFFDKNFNIVIPDFDYKKYGLTLGDYDFTYFIINDYIGIMSHFIDGYGQSRIRTIIEKAGGKEIINSTNHKCYPLGNFIQIVSENQSQFLNALTGEIITIELKADINSKGEIDLDNVNDVNQLIGIQTNNMLLLQTPSDTARKLEI